jgi:DNA-directed RNA polymerase specialized sigma24 family protein
MKAGRRQGHEVNASSELGTFRRHEYTRLVRSLSLYCGDRHIADELAQEAIARVCRDWTKVRRLAALRA